MEKEDGDMRTASKGGRLVLLEKMSVEFSKTVKVVGSVVVDHIWHEWIWMKSSPGEPVRLVIYTSNHLQGGRDGWNSPGG